MTQTAATSGAPSREAIFHALYEAAELEHNLMCTYLYAAFRLKSEGEPGVSAEEGAALTRWRRLILDVAIDEMGHLAAVWNITSALGGAPRFGRGNFPLDPGYLPAGVVVKLAPFNTNVLQHFIHLERPHGSPEPDGEGFAPERLFERGAPGPKLTPMGVDYDTVGDFYAAIGRDLQALVAHVGETGAFCGDPALQLSSTEVALDGVAPVICLKTALAAFESIITQGEGAPSHSETSHFQKFIGVREELAALRARNPDFTPAHPAAHNPVLRRPPRPEGRVWIEDEAAVATVDVANAAYGLMLRLVAYAYVLPSPGEEKSFAVDAALGLMRAMTLLGERAARLPAGPSHPECHAGVSFTALRDAASLPPGPAARRFLIERLAEIAGAAAGLAAQGDDRADRAARLLGDLAGQAERILTALPASSPPAAVAAPAPAPAPAAAAAEVSTGGDGLEVVEGKALTLTFEAKRCIHARFCVTGAPDVFLANVKGPWIHPDAMSGEDRRP
jgi:uncharacterized Fe-S cluster protein YjdI